MYKTKVVTKNITYMSCDLCGEELEGDDSAYYYHVSEYVAHYECVDDLVEKNVLEEARKALAAEKVFSTKSYVGHNSKQHQVK